LYEREDRQNIRSFLPKGNAAKNTPALRNLLEDLDGMDNLLKIGVPIINNPNRQVSFKTNFNLNFRQTRFDTNPTIINASRNGARPKKKRSKSSGSGESLS
jgi:hypothetical protein